MFVVRLKDRIKLFTVKTGLKILLKVFLKSKISRKKSLGLVLRES